MDTAMNFDRGRTVAALWTFLVIGMACADSFTGANDPTKVELWLLLFYMGVVGSAMLLIQPLLRGIGAASFFGGLFLGVYNTAWITLQYAQGVNVTYPIALYPFTIAATPLEWWLIILFGWSLLVAGASLLEAPVPGSRAPDPARSAPPPP
jgi:hypothetical protein